MIIEKVIILGLLIPQINTNSPNFSFDLWGISYFVFTVKFESIGREHVFHPIRRWINRNWRTSTWLWRRDFCKNLATYDYNHKLAKDPAMNTLARLHINNKSISPITVLFTGRYWSKLRINMMMTALCTEFERARSRISSFSVVSTDSTGGQVWTTPNEWAKTHNRCNRSETDSLDYIAFKNNEYRNWHVRTCISSNSCLRIFWFSIRAVVTEHWAALGSKNERNGFAPSPSLRTLSSFNSRIDFHDAHVKK